ncbi:MAG: cytochrome c oxidase assembly protein [Salinisphaeraceae bacterium]|nr:cytochrome c oxidase assembly protein [Salinisphaeraceae bacterium]
MEKKKDTLRHTGLLGLLVLGMFGFGFAMVPLYEVICEITGLNGRSDSLVNQAQLEESVVDTSRTVTVEFVTTVNEEADWEFKAVKHRMQVHPGEMQAAEFIARNTSGQDVIGQAVPSVSPAAAGRFLQKTECFCFEQQPFRANEERSLPLRFMIDPQLPAHVQTVTLAYTFFDATHLASNTGVGR